MNKKSLLSLAIALLLPLSCYFILRYLTDNAIDMPRRYLLDTVVTREEKGKTITDSIWHTTANIKLLNQLGDSVSLYDKQGKIIVAGPFGDDSNWRGIFIFNAPTKEEVEELLKTDPAVAAGRLAYEIHPWWTAKNSVFK